MVLKRCCRIASLTSLGLHEGDGHRATAAFAQSMLANLAADIRGTTESTVKKIAEMLDSRQNTIDQTKDSTREEGEEL